MTKVQESIFEAIESMGEKSRFTDTIVSKKIREKNGLEGKKKATISIDDLMVAISLLSEKGSFYSITVTNANDILIEKSSEPKEVSMESIKRRVRHEKSQILFTNKDFK